MKLLVTGGAGFIGSNFIIRTLGSGQDYGVKVLDALTYAADMRNLESVSKNKNYSFVKGDVRDHSAVEKAVDGCDAIVHFAAESHVDYSITNPSLFYETNVLGTLNLLEAARKRGIQFLHISTDEVYGDVKEGESVESDPLVPSSPYSASKAAADLLVGSYFRTYGMDVKITRTTNNYGPFQHIEKLIPKFVLLALMGRDLPVYGTGESLREWIHVNDNCDAILTVLKKGKSGSVYNIGTGQRKTVMDVARLIASSLGKSESTIAHEAPRPGEDARYALDSSRVRALGWSPKVPFEKGIAETVRWYAENRTWWEEKAKTHDLGHRHTKLHKP
jgi:dTDP-glucose 4,6-dehydratase